MTQKKVHKNSYPIKSHERNCLVISSCFFVLPSVIAFCRGIYVLGTVSVIISLISANYWRHAIPGWRKDLDLIAAKVSFVFYLIMGCMHIREGFYHIIGWPICFLAIYAFLQSGKKWDEHSPNWVYFHMMFHMCIASGKIVIILGGSKSLTGF